MGIGNTQLASGSSQRKEDHVRICTDSARYTVEHGCSEFRQVSFIHNALPEIDAAGIDTGCDFLGYRLRVPLLISAMTGGGVRGEHINAQVVGVAEECGIGVALGSMRALLAQASGEKSGESVGEDLRSHFALKKQAPNVPLIGNMGGGQLGKFSVDLIGSVCEEMGFDALSVHLNVGQECFQPNGDRDFTGIEARLGELCAGLPVPVIVKETGFGLSPQVVGRLKARGIRYVDVAGAGGTNWISVEGYRAGMRGDGDDGSGESAVAAGDPDLFRTWGIPTAYILAALHRLPGLRRDMTVISSGGVRDAGDVAKSIAMGAGLAGAALPFIQHIVAGGRERAVGFVRSLEHNLKIIMAQCGAGNIAELKEQALLFSRDIDHMARQLAQGLG